MRFDWYASTIRDDTDTVVTVLSQELGATVEEGNGLNGYARSYSLRRPSGVAARVLAGGANGWPHAFASGEDCDDFVPLVRTAWPDRHSVSRVDAAEDFDGVDCWDKLLLECLKMADDKGLRLDQQGDWIRAENGRTLYVGSRKSPSFVRLYEKGKQLQEQVKRGAPPVSDSWVRLELQTRPVGDARWRAAFAQPEDVWGYSAWTRELAARTLALDVERVQVNVWRPSDDGRALNALVHQYGAVLSRMAHTFGSWAAVGDYLGARIED